VGKISSQVKTEIKLLPFMIGKLLGGILAVIGFTAAVVIVTRRADYSFGDILPSALSGCLGVVLFVVSSRLLTRRLAEKPAENAGPDNRTRTSMLSWGILLLLAAIFLLLTYLLVIE
jgi:zinc transporter ZupT